MILQCPRLVNDMPQLASNIIEVSTCGASDGNSSEDSLRTCFRIQSLEDPRYLERVYTAHMSPDWDGGYISSDGITRYATAVDCQ